VSLRARLLTVVVSLTAIGLVVASIVTYQQIRTFLVDRVDRTATASAVVFKLNFRHLHGVIRLKGRLCIPARFTRFV
jgi:hypothetical protein